MAQTSYVSRVAANQQNRDSFYIQLASLLLHLDALNLNLISIVRNPDFTVTVTLNNPIPDGQLLHLGVQ